MIDLYKGLRARGWRGQHGAVAICASSRDIRTSSNRLDQNDITYVPMRRGPHASDLMAFSEIADTAEESNRGETILHAHSTKAGMIGSLMHSRVRASVFTHTPYRGVRPDFVQILQGVSQGWRSALTAKTTTGFWLAAPARDGVCQGA